jgi:murein DD-endopeptidase MepM/ murein hydrolase activator NlpD
VVARLILCLLVVLSLSEAAGAASAGKAGRGTVLEILQGDVAELHIAAEPGTAIDASLGKEPVRFFPLNDGHYAAMIGADVAAKPGLVNVFVRLAKPAGVVTEQQIAVRIKAKTFRTESFNVAPGFDEMTPEALAEVRREQAAFARVFSAGSAERFWDVPFIRPVPHEASASSFGFRRIINGIPRAPHSGTDLSAPAGTEVSAANHGRVVLVDNFFFAGGSVVLDHGAGLYTMYFHLSEFRVAEGTMVRRGDVIGLSGMTGRVTGPHLHWGARVAGARIDPLQLVEKFGAKFKTAADTGPKEN